MTMTDTELALLKAIKRHRAEDTPRLEYADFLQERDGPGDGEWAEFMRASIARATCGSPPWGDYLVNTWCEWDRGFYREVKTTAASLVRTAPKNAAKLLLVKRVELTDRAPARLTTPSRSWRKSAYPINMPGDVVASVGRYLFQWLEGDKLSNNPIGSFRLPFEIAQTMYGMSSGDERYKRDGLINLFYPTRAEADSKLRKAAATWCRSLALNPGKPDAE